MLINKSTSVLLLVFSLLINHSSVAEERIELEGISIIGNKELPKMLYIVPWKKSELPDINTPPIENLINEALAPVNRDNFKREIRYYQIYSKDRKGRLKKK